MRQPVVLVMSVAMSCFGAGIARAQGLSDGLVAPRATFLPALPAVAAPPPGAPWMFGAIATPPVPAARRAPGAIAARPNAAPLDCAMPVIAGDPAIDPKMPHQPASNVTFLGRAISAPPCPGKGR